MNGPSIIAIVYINNIPSPKCIDLKNITANATAGFKDSTLNENLNIF
jgi:hypothetical protein